MKIEIIKDNKREEVAANDITIDGVSAKQLTSRLLAAEKKTKELEKEVKQKQDEIKKYWKILYGSFSKEKDINSNVIDSLIDTNKKLELFLNECNVSTPNKTLKSMIEKLEEIIAIRNNKTYMAVSLNVDGYITNLTKVDGILELQPFPVDILRGYYKYVNGQLILDERKKLEWR